MSARDKIDARSRRALAAAPPDARVEALVRLVRRPADETLASIRAAGLEITSQLGPIVTGRARVREIERIAELEGVRSVQLSRLLYLEAESKDSP